MDRVFMKSFYKRYYDNPHSAAVSESEEYHVKQKERQIVEGELEEKLKKAGNELLQLFDKYMDVWSDEQEILLLAMYLLGAQDREKMLRGTI